MAVFAAFPPATYAATFVVTSTADDGSGGLTLREAIVDANNNPGPDIITFDLVYPATITLDGAIGWLQINDEVDIQGPGAANLTVAIAGASTRRVFVVNTGVTATISGMTITGGAGYASGGGIYNTGDLTITETVVSGNSALTSGGGIYNDSTGTLTIVDSLIEENTVDSAVIETSGGGIFNNGGSVEIINSTISDNSATGTFDNPHGGGVRNEGGSLWITDNSVVTNNNAFRNGGGVSNAGSMWITDSQITGNIAGSNAGGIYNDTGGSMWVTRSTVALNEAGSNAGGIYNLDGVMWIEDSRIRENEAGSNGAGIYNSEDTTIIGSTINDNDAGNNGGGVYNVDTITIINSTISGNTSGGDGSGHGAGIRNFGEATVSFSTIVNNNANGDGGGIDTSSGEQLSLTATIVAMNTAADAGPDILGEVTTDGGNNLLGNNSGSTGLTNGINGNIVGTNGSPVNPMLGDLEDNGGPTETHAVASSLSPVLDHIMNLADCTVPTDQRGATRPQGDGCEIGAYELFIQTYYQACLYAGSLSQVRFIGDDAPPTINCGRGTEVILMAAGDPEITAQTLHACLYAGSLSQVNTDGPPANCGRGMPIALAGGIELQGCLYAGRLSQLSINPPTSCGRGEPIGLTVGTN